MPVMYALTNLPQIGEEQLSNGLTFAFVDGPAKAEVFELSDEVYRALAAEYPRGVAFGPSREVRWLRRKSGFTHLVIISDEDEVCPEGAPTLTLTRLDGEEPGQILLAGRRKTAGQRWFQDGRIPEKVEYPDDSGAVAIAAEIRHYEADDGRRIWRYVRLKGAE